SIFYRMDLPGFTVAAGEGGVAYLVSNEGRSHSLRESFLEGASKPPVAYDAAATRVHYMVGKPHRWHKELRGFYRLRYADVWPGVDIDICTANRQVEKFIYLDAGASIDQVQFQITGADELSLNENGELILLSGAGLTSFSRPVAYQETESGRSEVGVTFHIINTDTYSFKLGHYDPSLPLTIDPVFTSTFIGGSDNEGKSIALDSVGNVYVTGYTHIRSYPNSTGPFFDSGSPNMEESIEVIVSKLSPDLSTLIASTYLGGAGIDKGNAIAVDADDAVFVVGETDSPDFPVHGALQANHGGQLDGFVLKMSSDLSEILTATYIGGTYSDAAYDLAVDPENGDIAITGQSNSNDFPVSENGYVSEFPGETQAYAMRFRNDLKQRINSTFLGSKLYSIGMSLAISPVDGDIYVGGITIGTGGFPDVFRFGPETGTGNAFVARFGAKLVELKSLATVGGRSPERLNAIAIAADGSVFISGVTESHDFPLGVNGYDRSYNGDHDVFISKLSADLESLSVSTFLGGSRRDVAFDIDIAANGTVYVTGSTYSLQFPTTPGAFDTVINAAGGTAGGNDVFVSALSDDLDTLVASTFIGEGRREYGEGITVQSSNGVYVTGQTRSSKYPVTPGAYNVNHTGGREIFVTFLPPDLTASSSGVPPRPDIPEKKQKRKGWFYGIKRFFGFR
ncbi:MAG: SBBP repeat-containing protein, partial [Verrucomicrobiota bacterium]